MIDSSLGKLFNKNTKDKYSNKLYKINILKSEKTACIIKSMTNNDFFELIQRFNMWRTEEKQISAEEMYVELSDKDIFDDDNDKMIIDLLNKMYTEDLFRDNEIFSINNNFFIIPRNQISKLTEEHLDTLLLYQKEYLCNPVYITIDEEGRFMIN